MKKTISTVKKDGEDARVKVTVEGDECPESGPQYRASQMLMLRQLADTPDLQVCGYWPFQVMKMFHNGNRWVVELTADKPLS